MSRFRFIVAALCCLFAGAVAHAQGFPDKPIRLIVAGTAGSSADGVARIIAARLGPIFRMPVTVEPTPGLGGNIAAERVARAAPDGHTLLIGSPRVLALNPLLYKALPYDAGRDFVPVARLVTGPSQLVASATLPAKTARELVAYARARPGKLRYGTAEAGAVPHLAMVAFMQSAGLEMVQVPYQDRESLLADVGAGRIEMAFIDPLSAAQRARAGRVRTLAVSSAARLPGDINTPTVAESGVPGFAVNDWFGVVAPARTPPDRIARLNAALNQVLAMPDVRAALAEQGFDPQPGTPEEFASFIRRDYDRWRKVVLDAKLSLG